MKPVKKSQFEEVGQHLKKLINFYEAQKNFKKFYIVKMKLNSSKTDQMPKEIVDIWKHLKMHACTVKIFSPSGT